MQVFRIIINLDAFYKRYIIMSCASFRVMLLFLDRSLITNCYVYLCNSCNVVSYKAVTVAFFLNIEEIESQ